MRYFLTNFQLTLQQRLSNFKNWLVLLLLPLLGLPEKQVAMMSAMFSWPQLVTALIGSFLAVTISPAIRKALHR